MLRTAGTMPSLYLLRVTLSLFSGTRLAQRCASPPDAAVLVLVASMYIRSDECPPLLNDGQSLLVYQEITVVMTALRIRRNLEKGKCMFDVSGPWAHKFSP